MKTLKKLMNNRYVLSSITTFVSVFLVTLGMQLGATIEWSSTVLFTLIMVAARVAAKAVIEGFVKKTGDL